MSDPTPRHGKLPKPPFDQKQSASIDDNPQEIRPDEASKWPSIAEQEHEQNQHAEQQLKQQQRRLDERSAFPKGNAQEHQQGNKHH